MSALHRFLLFLFMAFAHGAGAQQLRSGDLLFQNLDCGDMCDAIEAVTEGYRGLDFSHVGIVEVQADSVYIIEAIGAGVQRISLFAFRERTHNPIWVGRLKEADTGRAESIVRYALAQIGKPYDAVFEMKPDRFYCSELVYEAYRAAFGGAEVFPLQPMTFKTPGTGQFFPVWTAYYRSLGLAIPEGSPGINPGAISRSARLILFPLTP